ncbi:MAG: M48 family metallopeptidase [bacterium]
MAAGFTAVFVAALLLTLALKFWLAQRQIRHVAAHADRVPARFAERIGLEAHRKAAAYTIARQRVALVDDAIDAVLLLALTLGGGLSLLAQAVGATGGGGLSAQVALVAAVAVVSAAVGLPLSWYRQFRLEARFGFNRMTLGLFFADLLKGALVAAVLGLPIVAAVLALMAQAGSLWWLYAWPVWIGFNALVLVLYPTLIAPLFNKFEPLQDEGLVARVQALFQRAGFSAKGLFVMDGSRRSAHANAYFTGLGAAKRVVFFDTLLAKLTPGEVEAVLAHELGHFKLHHVPKTMIGLFAGSLAALALLGWLAGQSGFYVGLGLAPNLAAPNDALALLLFMLVLPSFTFFVSPVLAQFSRRHEFQADAFACQQADGRDLARALLKLHADNASTLTPDPLYVRFYYSHPPASERLAALPSPA